MEPTEEDHLEQQRREMFALQGLREALDVLGLPEVITELARLMHETPTIPPPVLAADNTEPF
jgi:hypothetical protein